MSSALVCISNVFFVSFSISRMAATGLHAALERANRYQSHLLQRRHKRGTQHTQKKKKNPKEDHHYK